MRFTLSITDQTKLSREQKISLGFQLDEDGHICINESGYMRPDIDIYTMDELMTFQKAYGDIIISGNEIEIYNGMRE